MSACLLVLDTASESLHLGLCRGPRQWVSARPGGARASTDLLPALTQLLDEARLGWADVQAIGHGRGPGAFTGVRTACAVTQGLAFGLGRPVLVLDTLMAVAEAARQDGAGDDIWVAMDARMGEAYAARYRHDPGLGGDGAAGRWVELDVPALHEPAALAERVSADPLRPAVAGSSLTAHAAAWSGWAGAARPEAVAHGAALLALARGAWARGEAVDAALALPLYVRDKVAQTTAERDALAVQRAGVASA